MKTPDSRAHVWFCSLFSTEACLDADHKVNIFINICSIRNDRSTAKETPFESLKIKIWIIITKLINARKLKYLFSLEYEEKIMIFLTNFLSTR